MTVHMQNTRTRLRIQTPHITKAVPLQIHSSNCMGGIHSYLE